MFNLDEIKYIDELIEKYKILEVEQSFLKIDIQDRIKMRELKYLVENATLLVNSSKCKNKERVLAIATILPKIIKDNSKIVSVCKTLLQRLKNFPAQSVVDKYNDIEVEDCISYTDKINRICDDVANTITIGDTEYILNDIQKNIYLSFKSYKNISVSAPTSIGKSFVITLAIIEELLCSNQNVVYVVPTRALIAQVMDDINLRLKEIGRENDFFVSCSSDVEGLEDESRGVFVLTQERLYQLCNNAQIYVGMIIIDEAQSIMEDSRGVLLEYSIKYAKRIWSQVRIIFISPFIKNPGKLLDKFNLGDSNQYFEKQSTVVQNVIKLKKQIRGYSVECNNVVIKEKLMFQKQGKTAIIVDVYQKFNNGENSIIYCNRAQIARNVCEKLYNINISENNQQHIDPELDEFAEFVELYIHKKYILGDYIRKGIVYHYGKLPGFIRNGIEELASDGKFKIIACTPTLLQGINVPAQNIYIADPKKGDDDLLSNLEFWNLAGRAGRMGFDLNGNIILIDGESWEDIDCYDVKDTQVRCASELTKPDVESFKKYLAESNQVNNEFFQHIESGMIFDILDKGHLDIQSGNVNEEDKREITETLEKVVERFIPPKELLIRLVGVSYKTIEEVWNYFNENSQQIEKLLPLHPLNEEFDLRYANMIKMIQEKIMNHTLYDYDNPSKLLGVSKAWIRESSLKNIIFYKYSRISDPQLITNRINEQIEYLEQYVRYRLIKGIYTYQEILKEYLKSVDKQELIEKMVNLTTFLEFGACRNIVVELITLGLNRELAIEVTSRFQLDEKDIKTSLNKIDLENSGINLYAKKRIKEFINKL